MSIYRRPFPGSGEPDTAGDVGLTGGVDGDREVGFDDAAVNEHRARRVLGCDRGRLDVVHQEAGQDGTAVHCGVVVRAVLTGGGDLRERRPGTEVAVRVVSATRESGCVQSGRTVRVRAVRTL